MLQGGAGAGGGGGGRVAMLAATSRTLLANFWDEALILAEDKVIEFLEVGGIMGFLMEEMVGHSLLSPFSFIFPAITPQPFLFPHASTFFSLTISRVGTVPARNHAGLKTSSICQL
jgi:hypothetical protein